MSNNWYSSWPGRGSSGESNNRRISNQFSGDVGSDCSHYVREDNQQKYGDISTEYITTYSDNAREGVNYNGDLRQGFGQRYEVNARCNNRGNFGGGYLQRYEEDRYNVDNVREGFKPKFGNNDRGNLNEINYTSNDKETFNCNKSEIRDFKVNTGKSKVMSNQGVENYYRYQIKEEDVGVKKELAIKSEKNIDNSDDLIRLKEISIKERAQNYITNLVKEEVTFSKIEVKKEPIVKNEMDDRISRSEYFKNQIKDETSSKKVEEKNKETREMNEAKDEARYHSEASTVTKWNQYACLKPDCPETFQFWQAARRHMEEGCVPNVKRKRGKKVEESKIKSQKQNKINPLMKEKVKVKIEKYACLKSNCPETFVTWGDARRHMEKGCLPNVKTKRGKKVERSIKKAKKLDIMNKPMAMEKKVPVKNEESEVSNLNQYADLKPDCPDTFGYACLKPDCPETFQFWGEARRHMAQGCLQTIKSKKCPPTIIYPTIGLPIVLSQKKAKKQRGMKPPMEEKAPLKMEKM